MKTLSFFDFFIRYYKSTNLDFPSKNEKSDNNSGRRFTIPVTKESRTPSIIVTYFINTLILFLILGYAFNFFGLSNFFQNLNVIYILLPIIFFMNWFILNAEFRFDFLRILLMFLLVYKKETNISKILIEYHFPLNPKKNGYIDFYQRFYNVTTKTMEKPSIPILYAKIEVVGYLNKERIKIKFKGTSVKICFKDELTVIEDTFNSPDELLNAVIEKLTQLKELDLIENPPLPPQNDSKKRKNKGKKKRK